MKRVETVIVGAGQAGLSLSYHLQQMDKDHILLEKDQVASSWRNGRWDSFTLVTPNWQLNLPGMEYDGDNPEGFLPREEVVKYLEDYADSFNPPVRVGVEVTGIEPGKASRFRVSTTEGDYEVDNVVVAAGTFQQPSIPGFSAALSEDFHQLHSSQYRNPEQLPPGGVLVVGSGQSGCQIAEELHLSGKDVYLSTSKVGRLPRRYRGRDSMRWMIDLGIIGRTVDDLDSHEERFNPNPHVSGKDGGHTINLHQFARDGIHLLGHLSGGHGTQVSISPDLHENLRHADGFAREIKQGVDKLIMKKGLDLEEDETPTLEDGFEVPLQESLDLEDAGIRTILWATGYDLDFSWVKFPVFDEFGYPAGRRGVTPQPGLYFLGLHWLHTIKSGLFLGVGEDAAHIAERIHSTGSS